MQPKILQAAGKGEQKISDKKSAFESIEDKIKRAAKEAEDFADKVTADEQPVEIVTDHGSPAPAKPSTPK